MTQKSTWLFKTHGQIRQVILEISTQRSVRDKNMHAHTNREEGKWKEQQPLGRSLGKEGYAWVGVGGSAHWEL